MMSPTPELADLVHSVSRGLRRSWIEELSPYGISPHQWRALRIVVHRAVNATPPRQRDVAEALRIAPRSAAEVIAQLESAGFVRRETDPDDKRAVLLFPTETGLAVEDEVSTLRSERGIAYFSTLSDQDREALERILTTLLADHPAPAGPHAPHAGPGTHLGDGTTR